MTRKYLIAGNWKMHKAPTVENSSSVENYRGNEKVETIVFPTYLDLQSCKDQGLTVGGQFAHPLGHGARTGDISISMLAETGTKYVMCGHSERRIYHGETDDFIAQSALAALQNGITPVICIGETWEEKESGKGEAVIKQQLETVLDLIKDSEFGDFTQEIIVAYEPVWAISGGDTSKPAATPEDAQSMHVFIRSLLPSSIQETTRILYGGSMKPENVESLLAQPDIDGGLVGGASLIPEKFQVLVDMAGKQ